MAAIELIKELQRQELDLKTQEMVSVYDGLLDEDKLNILNEWHTEWIECYSESLFIKFTELNIFGRLKAAINNKKLNDIQEAQWFGIESLANTKNISIFFDKHPINIPKFFEDIKDLEIINDLEYIWLMDLGRRQYTIGRKVMARDVTIEDLSDVSKLSTLVQKVNDRKTFIENEINRLNTELNETIVEIQKKDDVTDRLIGNDKYIPAWER